MKTAELQDKSEQKYDKPELMDEEYTLSPDGLSEEQRKKALIELSTYLQNQKENYLGYQVNQNMQYTEDFKQYLNMHINNVGDPFTPGNLTMNSKIMEKAVLDYYAKLWNAVTPHDKENGDSYWGYTLSMGSTEGNVYGIWNARDYLGGKVLLSDGEADQRMKAASENGVPARVPTGLTYQQALSERQGPNAYTPIAFYSQDTHYSIVKAMHVLNFETFYTIGSEKFTCPLSYPEDFPPGFSDKYLGKNGWPLEVPSNADGSIYIPALIRLVELFVSEGYPVFVCFNYGTTFKGAYDDIEGAVRELVPILKQYNMYEREVEYEYDGIIGQDRRSGFWFHVDGALGSAYMPFVEKAMQQGMMPLAGDAFPHFDFRIPEVHSIVMSGHKWIGAPYPCGVFMTKTKYQLLPPDDPMYIGSPDTTFAGSRNGLAAMMLWDHAARHSYENQVSQAVAAEKMARYAATRLRELENDLQTNLWVEHTPLSLTIRFKRPNEKIVFKYSLSCESVYVEGNKRSYAHMFTMQHVSEKLIDQLISDLKQPGAFEVSGEVSSCVTSPV